MEPPAPNHLTHATCRATLCLVLLLLTGVAFLPALENGFTSYDDPVYVTANPEVQQGLTLAGFRYALTAVVASNWHPVTLLSHMLDCQLYGLHAWGHHLTSVLLQAANTVLLFLLLDRLTGAIYRSFFVAAFFGLHPLRVESVAWVSERKDVLSLFFMLLALFSYVNYVRSRPGDDPAQPGTRWPLYYGLLLIFFLSGLMSKPMLVTFPFVLWLLDFWPLRRWSRKAVPRLVGEKVPLLALAVVICIVTVFTQKANNYTIPLSSLPLSARLETSFVSYARYLGKIFWPSNLCMFYPYPDHWPWGLVVASVMLVAGVSLGVVWVRKLQPWWVTGWLWFLGTLVPVIGLVQVGEQAMADRYTYIPSIGIYIGVVWSASTWIARCRSLVSPVITLASLTLLVCLTLSRHQIRFWNNSETLYRRAFMVTENNYAAGDLLGRELNLQNRFAEAVEVLKAAVHANPTVPVIHYDLGVNLERCGRLDEACTEYQATVELDPANLEAWNKLGMGLSKKHDHAGAITAFTAALRLDPGSADLHYNLGNAFSRTGRRAEAADQFQLALKLRPDDAGTHNNLGVVLFQSHRVDDAISEFQAALKLNPQYAEARRNLDQALKTKTMPPPASLPGH